MDNELFKNIINDRGNELDFYVLRYDMETTRYNNEIVFKTYDEAFNEFCNTTPNYKNERVELIFSPQMGDTEYSDNELLFTRRI